jgi:cytochrome c oxidase subunit 2
MATLRSRLRRLVLPASLLLPVLLLTGCISDDSKPMNIFRPEGEQSRKINSLHPWVFGIAGIVFVFVTGAVFWLVFKNRVNGDELDPEDLPAQVHGNTRLEISWTIFPAVLLAVLAVPTVATVWSLEEKEPDALPVMVVGQQWWWEYRYDVDGDGFFEGDAPSAGEVQHGSTKFDKDDLVVANELVIPAGRRIELTITSRDIIHSFWIPRLNGKRDAVPGRFHPWSIEADKPGKFVGWCTEFCGLSHARMRISAIALPPDQWQQWYDNQLKPAETPTDEAAAAGQATFVAQCATCHVVRNPDIEYPPDFLSAQVSGAAPNLTHFATRSVFAGAIYSQYRGVEPNDDDLDVSGYLDLAENGSFNEAQLKAWIHNAPSQKDMAPPDRGMPAFPGLTEEDLDNLVAYLATLD